jgi:dihydrofolate reductase
MGREMFDRGGATVLGKRTYDVGLPHWNDTPYPTPSFVMTHEGREPQAMKSASFVFVNDGIESAVAQAREAAGEKDVILMGASVSKQALKAGLVDEIFIQLSPCCWAGERGCSTISTFIAFASTAPGRLHRPTSPTSGTRSPIAD